MAQDFLARMIARGEQVEKNLNETVKAVALAAHQQIVTATPVDTGLARSNWIPSLNQPVTSPKESPFAPGSKGSTGGANIASALEEARQIISGCEPGQDIWISNNLPYIRALNYGEHSKQAPKNFVEQGVMAGLAELRRAKLLD